MQPTPKQIAKFLVKAKTETYAGDGAEVHPQRPGFKELEYKEGDLEYRDSYYGFFAAPGQEIVRFKGTPIWNMAYNGGMNPKFRDFDLAKQTYAFLKKALLLVEEVRPFRGPNNLKQGDWEYTDQSQGDIKDFKGTETITYKGEEVFRQDYIGGLILEKEE